MAPCLKIQNKYGSFSFYFGVCFCFPLYPHQEKECTPSWTFVQLAPKSSESHRPPYRPGRNRGTEEQRNVYPHFKVCAPQEDGNDAATV